MRGRLINAASAGQEESSRRKYVGFLPHLSIFSKKIERKDQ